MGYYSDNRGKHMDVDDVTLHASGEETADGSSDALEVAGGTARLTLDVTAVGADADETLDVTVETSEDGSTGWATVDSFAQVAQPGGATSERKLFSGLDRFIRCTWDVAGTTPEFTFEVSGEVV